MRSLSQFQALQDGEQELVSLRELGLTDAEIQLWLKRESPEQEEKVGDGLIVGTDKCDRISLTVAENIYIPAVSSQFSRVCGRAGLVCVKPSLTEFI